MIQPKRLFRPKSGRTAVPASLPLGAVGAFIVWFGWFGLAGGQPGQVGENWVRRNDGRMERLKGADANTLDGGEAVIIQTPTAGGYGNLET